MHCPGMCSLNLRGDTCIPWIENSICSRSNKEICPGGCYFDDKHKLCKSKTRYDSSKQNNIICEPMMINSCNYENYITDPYIGNPAKDYALCSTNNAIDICYDDYRKVVLYPLRLKENYSGTIKCRYSNCNNHGCQTGKCDDFSQICCDN